MRIFTRRAATVLAAGLLTAMVASAAVAETNSEVTQSVAAGSLTASMADVALSEVAYSHSDQVNTGSMTLTADDSTGTGDGWGVTIQAGDFAYSGGNDGETISAANFALTDAAGPVHVAGQEIDAAGGPNAVTTQGSLDQAREVLNADADFGQGEYTQALDVALTVPGQSRAGTYTATVTTTVTAGPSA